MARTELQLLLNEPVVVNVQAAGGEMVRVEIKEPMQADLGRYLTLIDLSIKRLLKDNLPLIAAAYSGKSVQDINADASALPDLFSQLTAAIMDREHAWVQANVSPRQQAFIVEQFLEVLGWEFIKETFHRAMRGWKGLTPKKENDAAPSWLVGASPTSPDATN